MTPEAFRKLVLSFPRAREREVFGTREYRVRDKAFATWGWPQDGWITVKVSAPEQEAFIRRYANCQPIPGRPGVVRLYLADLDENDIRPVVDAAWKLATAPG